MSATREAITQALLSKLSNTGVFVTVARRNRDPESIPTSATPALFLLGHSETAHRKAGNLPPIRTLHFRALIYTDAGQSETVIPDAILNPLLDGIETALAPDNLVSGFCTLGGLVYSVRIEGETIKAPGDVSGKGLAIVPIEVVIP